MTDRDMRWMSIGHHPNCDQSRCDDEPPTPACTCPYWWHDAFPLIDELIEEIRVLYSTLEECADIVAENKTAAQQAARARPKPGAGRPRKIQRTLC